MNRTASEVAKSLRKKLIRLAQDNPELRAKLKPQILALADPTRVASFGKVAIKPETEEFIQWALNTQSPMSPHEVEAFVNRQLGIKTSEKVKKRPGPRFQRGDQVEIKKDKHKLKGADPAPYHLFNGKIGTVVEVDGDDALVAFKGEPAPVRFQKAQAARGVGIYSYKPPYEIKGSAKIEMIYEAGGKASPDAIATVEVYLGKGRGSEKRSGQYYTGHVTFASVGDNGFYFKGYPQQRMRVDPASEAGYQARTFNPSVGRVLYLGVFGSRPSRWKDELEKLRAEAAA
jgi:hypothetical protein